mmetsp:Transcript_20491/g.44474  ORF Transcript_20491/g.44474 Transcript_20491/m.44474 type:complete len:415 (-) Transcript_20491:279-1523(-)
MVAFQFIQIFLIANLSTTAAFSSAHPSFLGTHSLSLVSSDGAVRLAVPRSMLPAPSTSRDGISSITGRTHSTHLQSTTAAAATYSADPFPTRRERILFELKTFLRVLLPATLSGITAFLALPAICFQVANFVTRVTDPAKIGMLSDVVSSFISLVGLLYSILVGQVFGFLYSQQEALYYALFDEVTEAKSLLEQVALVSQGRTMYSTCLNSIARYVKEDLLGGTLSLPPTTSTTDGKKKTKSSTSPSVTPSLILSARPADDPLEAILYLTSVGIPGQIYDTVRSLRQARSRRLGALQRKVPVIHLIMLWILGLIMIMTFPVLVGVGGAAAAQGKLYTEIFPWSGYKVMTLQGGLFGVATFAVVMTKMVLGELWRAKGGAYNVDAVLRVMVRGLQKELDERMMEAKKVMKRSKQE